MISDPQCVYHTITIPEYCSHETHDINITGYCFIPGVFQILYFITENGNTIVCGSENIEVPEDTTYLIINFAREMDIFKDLYFFINHNEVTEFCNSTLDPIGADFINNVVINRFIYNNSSVLENEE